MKTKMKTAIAFTALLMGFVSYAQDKAITIAQLPANAQNFVKKNFAKETVASVWEDKEMFDTDYTVRFGNGTEVEFDDKGNWEEVDGNHSAVPLSILPATTATYLAQHYKGQNVVQIDKKNWGYKVEFANDLELEFDNSGKFLRIDD